MKRPFHVIQILVLGCVVWTMVATRQLLAVESPPIQLPSKFTPEENTTVSVVLNAVGEVYGVRFCLESIFAKDRIALPDQKLDTAILVGKTLPQFLDFIRSNGISAEESGNAIFLKKNDGLPSVNDPLDFVIQRFVFKGKRNALIQILNSCFPEVPPTLAVDSPSPETVEYDFDFPNPVSIRTILQQLTARYGVTWYFYVGEWKMNAGNYTALDLSRFPTYNISWTFGNFQ